MMECQFSMWEPLGEKESTRQCSCNMRAVACVTRWPDVGVCQTGGTPVDTAT